MKFKIGDWVLVDGRLGKVTRTSWSGCEPVYEINGDLWYFETDISKPTQH